MLLNGSQSSEDLICISFNWYFLYFVLLSTQLMPGFIFFPLHTTLYRSMFVLSSNLMYKNLESENIVYQRVYNDTYNKLKPPYMCR